VRAALLAVIARIGAGGVAGVVVFVGANVAGAVVTLPFALYAGVAGYVFGPVRGALLASPSGALAATGAFLVGRFVLAGRVARWADGNARWEAIHRAVDRDPFRVALLIRLTPLGPQNLVTYILSVTRLRPRTFIAATWIGLLPMTCFNVYLGSLVRDAADLLDGKRPPLGPWGYAATGAGVVVTGTILFLMARAARRALAESGL
jgi:uncharacterized membrane protein YdjX (TVP38/TMEM64 family)